MESDLSEYELARLARIERNRQKLIELGLDGSHFLPAPEPKARAAPTKKPPRAAERAPPREGTRASKRLKGLTAPAAAAADRDEEEEEDAAAEDEAGLSIDYAGRMPQEPDELDDDEFEVYTTLRTWRLLRHRALEIEPYKICQNRTLCELVRRRRNDRAWAAGAAAAAGAGAGAEDAATPSAAALGELCACWGIGPSKAAPGGFGAEMLGVLARAENAARLERSRQAEGRAEGAEGAAADASASPASV